MPYGRLWQPMNVYNILFVVELLYGGCKREMNERLEKSRWSHDNNIDF